MELCANISMLFTEAPLAERVGLAAKAGFAAVEIQFPAEEEIEALDRARRAAGIPIALINVPIGGPGEVGLAALPGREADFVAALDVCAAQARRLEVAKVNVLSGRPPADVDPEDCHLCLSENLRRAGDRFAPLGVKVMVEPVNPHDVPGFFLTGLDAGLAALERAAHPNLFLQFDFYHMSITEPDLPQAIRRAGACIGHVQFADAPGRHEPGSGRIDFETALAALRRADYDGVVSAEYRPAATTQEGLSWLLRFREAMQ